MFGFDTDEEQVAKVLRGEKMSSQFWCKVGFHIWERWVVTNAARLDSNSLRRYEELRRECKYCGLPQLRTEWETNLGQPTD